MEILFILTAILQSVAIALGVGSSTIAIVNFFVAIADKNIEPAERKMMGVTYAILRVAMVLIFLTTTALTLFGYYQFTSGTISPYGIAFFILILVLYINAILMTRRIMPSTLGPALQAGTWYTLGVLGSLLPLGLTTFTLLQFIIAYVIVILFATALVNGLIAYYTTCRNHPNQTQK